MMLGRFLRVFVEQRKKGEQNYPSERSVTGMMLDSLLMVNDSVPWYRAPSDRGNGTGPDGYDTTDTMITIHPPAHLHSPFGLGRREMCSGGVNSTGSERTHSRDRLESGVNLHFP